MDGKSGWFLRSHRWIKRTKQKSCQIEEKKRRAQIEHNFQSHITHKPIFNDDDDDGDSRCFRLHTFRAAVRKVSSVIWLIGFFFYFLFLLHEQMFPSLKIIIKNTAIRGYLSVILFTAIALQIFSPMNYEISSAIRKMKVMPQNARIIAIADALLFMQR